MRALSSSTQALVMVPGPPWRVLVRNELRVLLRNRTGLFWVFLFPVLLFLTLGLALSGGGRVGVQIVDRSASAEGADLAKFLRDGLARSGRSHHGFVASEGKGAPFRLTVGTTSGVETADPLVHVRLDTHGRLAPGDIAALEGEVQDLLANHALLRAGVRATSLVSSTREVNEAQAYRRFLFSGVLVLMLLSGGFLSVSLMLIAQREQGILTLPAIWPISPYTWLFTVLGTRGAVLLVAALCFLLFGHVTADIGIHWSPARMFDLVVTLTLAVVMFLSIGHAVAARCRSEATAEFVSNSIYYPMLLLGDLTIPLRELPMGLDRILVWLPTTQVAGALRSVLWAPLHDGPSWPQHAYLVLVTAASVLIAGASFGLSDRSAM